MVFLWCSYILSYATIKLPLSPMNQTHEPPGAAEQLLQRGSKGCRVASESAASAIRVVAGAPAFGVLKAIYRPLSN